MFCGPRFPPACENKGPSLTTLQGFTSRAVGQVHCCERVQDLPSQDPLRGRREGNLEAGEGELKWW